MSQDFKISSSNTSSNTSSMSDTKVSQEPSGNPLAFDPKASTKKKDEQSKMPQAFQQPTPGKLSAPMDPVMNQTIEKRLGQIRQQCGWRQNRDAKESVLAKGALDRIDGDDSGKVLSSSDKKSEMAEALSEAQSRFEHDKDQERHDGQGQEGQPTTAWEGLGAHPLAAGNATAEAQSSPVGMAQGTQAQRTIDMINTLVNKISVATQSGQTQVKMELKDGGLPPALQGASLTVVRTDQGGVSVTIANPADEAAATKLIRDNVSQLALGLQDKGVQLTEIVVGTTNVHVPESLKESIFSGFGLHKGQEATNTQAMASEQSSEQHRQQQDQQQQQDKRRQPSQQEEDETP